MPSATETKQYEQHKQREAARSRRKSASGRDIGEIPPIVDRARRDACEFDLRLFLETYLSEQLYLAWSPAHLLAIAKMQRAILKGGLFALAMPRGSGKSTLTEGAALWAILYGHRRFVAIIGAEADQAEEIAESLRVELESNELLYEDFPEVCYPIGCLDGIVNRANGQLHNGERTRIKWTGKLLRLPSIEGSPSYGAIVKTLGITGRVRGLKFKLQDGTSLRPDLVLIDDPQTDESAKSVEQNKTRLKVLTKAVLGLAGPGKKIAGMMPCTVIEPGDFIDQILDPLKYPQWQGQRTKLLEAKPTSPRWEEYAELWKRSHQEGRGLEDCCTFYRAHFDEMNEGAKVSWPERFNEDEIDALQHCMNLILERGIKAFEAEYNNNPLPDETFKQLEFDCNAAATKLPRRTRAPWAIKTTCFIDVQQEALFWLACDWAQNFSGHVRDYGIWPEQPGGQVCLLAELRHKLSEGPGGLEARLTEGLKNCIGFLKEKFVPDAIGIDANWGLSTDTVYQVAHDTNTNAMHGKFYSASAAPLNSGRPKPGTQRGYYWQRIIEANRTRIVFDSNAWKSAMLQRLLTPAGDPGAISFCEGPHDVLDYNFHAENYVEVWARGMRKDEWKQQPGVDNHFWDAFVGCGVLANFQGCQLPTWQDAGPKRVSFADMQRRAMGG